MSVTKLLNKLRTFRYNPAGIQQSITEHLEEITDGKIDVVDPTNPFVFLLESACVNTAAFMVENEVNTRKQYPAAAQTNEDLYIHMSDVDFVDRFAIPANTKFTIIVNKQDLLDNLVFDPATNSKKIVIPRNTYFTVNKDYVFSMQYPVEIRQLSHGGLQIVYDTDVQSPLLTLTSNVVKHDIKKISNTQEEWLYMEVDVQQFKIETYSDNIAVKSFVRKYPFSDQFYFARVYNKSVATAGKWIEVKTTHTDQVYDVNTPTVLLKVIGNELTVSIPRVYLTTQKITGSLRVDIYETKGKLTMSLGNYNRSNFDATWYVVDSSEVNQFVAPLRSLKSIGVYSAEFVDSGRSAIGFEELRQRVIKNSVGQIELPITNVRLETSLNNKGYSLVKDVDVVTNRVFLATKPMPVPFDERLITAGNSSIGTLMTTMASLQNNPLVKINDQRITIPSNSLFVSENGIIKILDSFLRDSLFSLDNEAFVKHVNEKNYLYNPFHYVLDPQANEFSLRCYYLDNPQITSISFIDQNDSTGIGINTDITQITKEDNGYTLKIVFKRNETAKNISLNLLKAQLSFIGRTGVRSSIEGTPYLNPNYGLVFQFDLNSDFDLDSLNQLKFNNFNYLDSTSRDIYSLLEQEFDLVVYMDEPMDQTWSRTQIDTFINKQSIGFNNPFGINHEKLKIKFGNELSKLWSRSRSVVQGSEYEKHQIDVPLTYEDDVFLTDPVTGGKFTIDENNNIVYNILYRKGDVVLDSSGSIVYKHRQGDVKFDINDKPIPINPSSILRQMDLFLIDGVYLLANDISSKTYRDQITQSVVYWVTEELEDMNSRVLEQTKIFFYPKTNLGGVKVLADQSQVINLDASQIFNIQLYVRSSVYKNNELRNFLTRSTIRKLDELLNNSVISISTMITELKAIYGQDVISINMKPFGGNNNINTITMLNDGERCSIGKKLQALPNGDRIVVENVNINFIEHELNT